MKSFFRFFNNLLFLFKKSYCSYGQGCALSSRRALLFHLISRYGFIECNEARVFLSYCCSEEIFRAEAVYLEEKLGACLLNHDNGELFFEDLKQAHELVTAISRSHLLIKE